MADHLQVMTTIGTKEDARKLAEHLVGARLAACVQISGPITSVYRWQGKLETAEEWYCLIKTRGDLYQRLESAIREIHPYEVPEILAVPVVQGNKPYLDWLEGELVSRRG